MSEKEKKYFNILALSIIAGSIIAVTVGFIAARSYNNRNSNNEAYSAEASDYLDLVKIEGRYENTPIIHDSANIYYDRNTKVMYFGYYSNSHYGWMCPIYNADGSLKLYDGE